MATPKLPRLAVASPTGSDGTSNKIQNLILLGLPADELTAATRKLQFVELPTHTVLHEAGEPLTHAYFINSGLASVLSVMTDGKSVEVGLAGKEGFIGLPLVVGLSSSPTQVIMQVGGSAYQLAAADFKELLSRSPTLEKSLNRYAQSIAMQATHVAACNRLHEVDERLARWLLMSQDRLGGDIVPLDTRISRAHARHPPRKRHRRRRHSAEGRFDYLQSWQRPDRQSQWPGRRLLRMLCLHQTPNRKVGKGTQLASVRYRADSARTPP